MKMSNKQSRKLMMAKFETEGLVAPVMNNS